MNDVSHRRLKVQPHEDLWHTRPAWLAAPNKGPHRMLSAASVEISSGGVLSMNHPKHQANRVPSAIRSACHRGRWGKAWWKSLAKNHARCPASATSISFQSVSMTRHSTKSTNQTNLLNTRSSCGSTRNVAKVKDTIKKWNKNKRIFKSLKHSPPTLSQSAKSAKRSEEKRNSWYSYWYEYEHR